MGFWSRLFNRTELADDAKKRRIPATAPMRDLPITSIGSWNDVQTVKGALNKLIAGQFDYAAQMFDAMFADDRIRGLFEQRIKALLGQPINFETGDDSDTAKKAAEWFEEKWGVMVPEPAAAELLKWGHGLGLGVAELTWARTESEWVPSIRVYHPKFVYWRWDTRSYWITTVDGTEEITPGDGRWLLFTPYGYQRGWMSSLVRCLAIPWLIRQFTYRDWARFSEVYGSPIRVGKVPRDSTVDEKKRFLRELAALANETSILAPINENGFGYGVELIEATATNWQAFDKLIEKSEDSMAIAILGQTLTTGAKSGGLGTGGVAQVHEKVRGDLLKSDSKNFGQCLHDHMLVLACRFNFGSEDVCPTPSWEVDPPEDLGEKATTLNNLGLAVTALKGAGVPLDTEALAEEFQLPLLSPEEHAKRMEEENAQKVDQAKAMAEAMGKVAPGGDDSGPPPSKADLSRGLLSTEKPKGFVKGQVYTDDLADAHIEAAKKVIAPDLETLLAIVKASASYEDLRNRLLHTYKNMRPAALSNLIRKAIVLAELNGRDSVLEDV